MPESKAAQFKSRAQFDYASIEEFLKLLRDVDVNPTFITVDGRAAIEFTDGSIYILGSRH